MQDAVAQEKAAGGQRLLASEEQIMQLRADLAQHLVVSAASEESIVAQVGDLKRLEQQVAAQQKVIREGQHELDAHESTNTLLREQAEKEHQALLRQEKAEQERLRDARERDAATESRIAQLESELAHQRNAMRDAVSWAKANTKQRLRSAESRQKDLQLQLDQHREAESQLALQENELRELLELAKLQGEQDLQACEDRNIGLRAELSEQRNHILAFEARSAELEDLLQKQREATAVEASAMEQVSELAGDLAKQRDDAKEACEVRVRKLKARIKDLEVMLEISKEFLRGDPSKSQHYVGSVEIHDATLHPVRDKTPMRDRTLAPPGYHSPPGGLPDDTCPARDAEPSLLGLEHSPPVSLPDDTSASKLGRSKVPKVSMRNSHSASSLNSLASSQSGPHPHVLRKAGFNWPGRHLGPDEEGPVKVKFEEQAEK